MKRLLLPLIAGLLVGVGGGTGFYMMRAPDSSQIDLQAVADSLAAEEALVDSGDSTAAMAAAPEGASPGGADTTSGGSPAGATGSGDGPPAEGGTPVPTAAADPTAAQTAAAVDPGSGVSGVPGAGTPAVGAPASGAPATGEPVASGPTPATSPENTTAGTTVDREDSARRMARIFSTMQPRDAAKVMTLMDRGEIELVLRQLDNRSAAKILAGLDPDLAADLSQALMRPGGTR